MRAVIWIMLLTWVCGAAQAPSTLPVFEVASIKPSPPFSPGPNRSTYMGMKRDAERLSISNVPLKFTIRTAFDFNTNERIEGGPGWLDSEMYDIIGTFPTDTPADRVLLMLQSLLSERCKLVAHRETREQPVYAFVPAKDGVKLKPYDASKPGNGNRGGRGHEELHGVTLSQFGNFIRTELGRVLVDGTGLPGTFDITLDWTPADTAVDDPKAGGPSLTTALQEQLGLKLESRRAPIEYLVIDHIERPGAN
jgi:uncharacterized protein (TIGR03435 family)